MESIINGDITPALLPNARFETLSSQHGHDAFLIEMETLSEQIADFRASLARAGTADGAGWRKALPAASPIARTSAMSFTQD